MNGGFGTEVRAGMGLAATSCPVVFRVRHNVTRLTSRAETPRGALLRFSRLADSLLGIQCASCAMDCWLVRGEIGDVFRAGRTTM